MNSKLRPRRVAAIVALTAALSSASMLTCGNAAANPYEQLLNAIGRAASREGVVPAIDDAIRQGRVALAPAERASAGSQSQLLKIKNKACDYNNIVNVKGGAVYDVFWIGYSESERQDVLAQYREFSKQPAAFVAIVCRFNS